MHVYKLDTDALSDLAQRYGAPPIPRVVLFHGGEPAHAWTGYAPEAEDAYRSAIDAALESSS